MPLSSAIGVMPSLSNTNDGRSRHPALMVTSANEICPVYVALVRFWHFQNGSIVASESQLQNVCQSHPSTLKAWVPSGLADRYVIKNNNIIKLVDNSVIYIIWYVILKKKDTS